MSGEKKNLKKNILVVPSEKLNLEEGFIPKTKEEILALEKMAIYRIREEMEVDENFQQLIPYVAIKKGDKILTYKRSQTGGEGRLYDKYAIGVGGHIDEPDNLVKASLREIEEEIDLKLSEEDLQFVGLINLLGTEVDRVHLGIAILVEIDEDLDFQKGELDKILNRSFDNKEDLEKKKDKFEYWSQVFFESYLKDIL